MAERSDKDTFYAAQLLEQYWRDTYLGELALEDERDLVIKYSKAQRDFIPRVTLEDLREGPLSEDEVIEYTAVFSRTVKWMKQNRLWICFHSQEVGLGIVFVDSEHDTFRFSSPLKVSCTPLIVSKKFLRDSFTANYARLLSRQCSPVLSRRWEWDSDSELLGVGPLNMLNHSCSCHSSVKVATGPDSEDANKQVQTFELLSSLSSSKKKLVLSHYSESSFLCLMCLQPESVFSDYNQVKECMMETFEILQSHPLTPLTARQSALVNSWKKVSSLSPSRHFLTRLLTLVCSSLPNHCSDEKTSSSETWKCLALKILSLTTLTTKLWTQSVTTADLNCCFDRCCSYSIKLLQEIRPHIVASTDLSRSIALDGVGPQESKVLLSWIKLCTAMMLSADRNIDALRLKLNLG